MIRTQMARLLRRLEKAGVPRSLVRRMLPHWWSDDISRDRAGHLMTASHICDYTGIPLKSMLGNNPLVPRFDNTLISRLLDARDKATELLGGGCHIKSRAGLFGREIPYVNAWDGGREIGVEISVAKDGPFIVKCNPAWHRWRECMDRKAG